jgi:hypothetical protein
MWLKLKYLIHKNKQCKLKDINMDKADERNFDTVTDDRISKVSAGDA